MASGTKVSWKSINFSKQDMKLSTPSFYKPFLPRKLYINTAIFVCSLSHRRKCEWKCFGHKFFFILYHACSHMIVPLSIAYRCDNFCAPNIKSSTILLHIRKFLSKGPDSEQARIHFMASSQHWLSQRHPISCVGKKKGKCKRKIPHTGDTNSLDRCG